MTLRAKHSRSRKAGRRRGARARRRRRGRARRRRWRAERCTARSSPRAPNFTCIRIKTTPGLAQGGRAKTRVERLCVRGVFARADPRGRRGAGDEELLVRVPVQERLHAARAHAGALDHGAVAQDLAAAVRRKHSQERTEESEKQSLQQTERQDKQEKLTKAGSWGDELLPVCEGLAGDLRAFCFRCGS